MNTFTIKKRFSGRAILFAALCIFFFGATTTADHIYINDGLTAANITADNVSIDLSDNISGYNANTFEEGDGASRSAVNITLFGSNTLIGGFVGAVIFAVVFVALQLHYCAIMRRKDKTLASLKKESEDMDEKIRRLRIENDRLSEKSNYKLD